MLQGVRHRRRHVKRCLYECLQEESRSSTPMEGMDEVRPAEAPLPFGALCQTLIELPSHLKHRQIAILPDYT